MYWQKANASSPHSHLTLACLTPRIYIGRCDLSHLRGRLLGPRYIPIPWVPFCKVDKPSARPTKPSTTPNNDGVPFEASSASTTSSHCLTLDTPNALPAAVTAGYTQFILTSFVVTSGYGFSSRINVTDGNTGAHVWDFHPTSPLPGFPLRSSSSSSIPLGRFQPPTFKAFMLADLVGTTIPASAVDTSTQRLQFSKLAAKATDKVCFSSLDNDYLVFEFNIIYYNPVTRRTLSPSLAMKNTGSTRPLAEFPEDAPSDCWINMNFPTLEQESVAGAEELGRSGLALQGLRMAGPRWIGIWGIPTGGTSHSQEPNLPAKL